MRVGLESRSISVIAGSSVPVGMRGLVHVWGRNDMSTTQRLGIGWVVQDPDYKVVEEYGTWEAWPYTAPGAEHEFIGGRFDINKPGTWRIIIELRMNPDSPVVVDTYEGVLCVAEEVVEEFAGTISKMELEYDETRGSIPVY